MQETWNGFLAEQFVFEGKDAQVVFPPAGTANGLLAIKTEYRDAFPQAIETGLLQAGFHVCFVTNSNRWGTDEVIDRQARFARHVAEKLHLNGKIVPVGMSCGGLNAIKLAAKYPEMISCLYLDAPVVNYLSCPCGFGRANPLDEGRGVPEILHALELENVGQLIGYRDMPLDKIPVLAEHKIPAVLVAGDADTVVPFEENGAYLQKAYEKAGVDLFVRIKPGCDHHPHGLDDPGEALQFILKHVK